MKSLKVFKITDASAPFEERSQKVSDEAVDLSQEIHDAIAATDADSQSTWALGGYKTSRVAFVDVSGYDPTSVKSVVNVYEDAGYTCNLLNIAGEGQDVRILAVLWDQHVAEGATEMEALAWAAAGAVFEHDEEAETGDENDPELPAGVGQEPVGSADAEEDGDPGEPAPFGGEEQPEENVPPLATAGLGVYPPIGSEEAPGFMEDPN